MSKEITRRNFIIGAAAGAASVATFGLTACAQPSAQTPTPTPAPTPVVTPPVVSNPVQNIITPQTAGAYLNPQDYDYTSNSITDFSKTTLFSDWKLGPLTLNHRMVKSAAGSDTFASDLMEETLTYHANFAKGGVQMIWCEDFANLLTKYASPRKKDPKTYPLKDLVNAVHAEGGYIGYQTSSMSVTADDMTLEDIAAFHADVIDGAKILQDAGFDAIEINAAGNNVGQTFLSRNRNHRTDNYGPQSFENRARFVTEMIQGIKKACGKDFIVQVLINGIEENDQNLGNNSLYTTVDENKEIAKLLEAAGADSLHVRLGPAGMHVCQFASDLYFTGYGIEGTTGYGNQFDFTRHWEGRLITNHSGCGMMLDVAKAIKEVVSIPVGTVTYMDPAHAPDFFEQALKDGKVDFLLMTRPLTVDTEYVNKLRNGRIDEIAPCTRCMHCHFDKNEEGKTYEHCRVNACTQHAYRPDMPEGYDPLPANGSKNVMVVGGGPAGMEAARVAAQRGYSVTLYEKKGMVGGLLPFASAIKGPHENLNILRNYLEHQMELKGVKVVTGQEVDANFIKEQAPDVVILAIGGKRSSLGLKGTGGTNIVSIDDIASADIGENVTIVGSNAQAVDVALYLIAQGKHVTIVSPDPIGKLDKGQSEWVKTFTLPMIYAHGTRVWPESKISSVNNGEISVFTHAGINVTIPCDTVIEAMDMLENTEIVKGLSGIETHAVGDCNKPWNIAEAIISGNLIARKI